MIQILLNKIIFEIICAYAQIRFIFRKLHVIFFCALCNKYLIQILYTATTSITLGYYYTDYFGVLPLFQYYSGDHIDFLLSIFIAYSCLSVLSLNHARGVVPQSLDKGVNFYFELCRFLCYFILFPFIVS